MEKIRTLKSIIPLIIGLSSFILILSGCSQNSSGNHSSQVNSEKDISTNTKPDAETPIKPVETEIDSEPKKPDETEIDSGHEEPDTSKKPHVPFIERMNMDEECKKLNSLKQDFTDMTSSFKSTIEVLDEIKGNYYNLQKKPVNNNKNYYFDRYMEASNFKLPILSDQNNYNYRIKDFYNTNLKLCLDYQNDNSNITAEYKDLFIKYNDTLKLKSKNDNDKINKYLITAKSLNLTDHEKSQIISELEKLLDISNSLISNSSKLITYKDLIPK